MSEQVCKSCGAVYEVTSHKLPVRDKDSIDCDICGAELIAWNGGVTFSARLKHRGNSNQPRNQEG